MEKKKFILCILDGYGIKRENFNNPLNQAKKINIDSLFSRNHFTVLDCSPSSLGFSFDENCSSSSGHLVLGTGRKIGDVSKKIDDRINNGSFFNNKVFKKVIRNAANNYSKLHVVVSISDVENNASFSHVIAFIRMCRMYGLSGNQVLFNIILDGSEGSKKDGLGSIQKLLTRFKSEGLGNIASICGKYYVYDTTPSFYRVYKTYESIVNNSGVSYSNPKDYIISEYSRMEKEGIEVDDSYIIPAYDSTLDSRIEEDDSIVFLNYNYNNISKLATLICNPDYFNYLRNTYDGFRERAKDFTINKYENLIGASLIEYPSYTKLLTAFEDDEIENTIYDILSRKYRKILACTETLKKDRLLYDFNGQKKLNHRVHPLILESEKTLTYNLIPELKTREMTELFLSKIKSENYEVGFIEFACLDTLAHCGEINSSIKGVEVADECVGKLVDFCKSNDYKFILVSSNSLGETIIPAGENFYTVKLTNKVPFVIDDEKIRLKENSDISDFLPTLLKYLNIKIPEKVTGKSIIYTLD